MLPEGLFFDFDGVIVDTETPWLDCVARFCRSRGADVTREALLPFLGDGDVQMLRFVSSRCGMSEDAIMAVLRPDFAEATRSLGMRPGIAECLDWAARAGLRLALVSNSDDTYIWRWLRRLGIEERFHAVITRSSGLALKPSPEMYICAARMLGVEPGCVVCIEDSPMGLRSALAAGLLAAAYPNGCLSYDMMEMDVPYIDPGREAPEAMARRVVGYYATRAYTDTKITDRTEAPCRETDKRSEREM